MWWCFAQEHVLWINVLFFSFSFFKFSATSCLCRSYQQSCRELHTERGWTGSLSCFKIRGKDFGQLSIITDQVFMFWEVVGISLTKNIAFKLEIIIFFKLKMYTGAYTKSVFFTSKRRLILIFALKSAQLQHAWAILWTVVWSYQLWLHWITLLSSLDLDNRTLM